MVNRRWILILLSSTLISVLAGCGNSGSTFNVQNPPPPPAAGVSIAFQPVPPASVQIGSTASLTAVVSNDSSNAGVTWTLTCSVTGNCGSVCAPSQATATCVATANTPSGSPVTYYPPSALSGNTEIVNIVGFATADHTKNVLDSITVTGFGNNLQAGNYVLQAQGVDANTGEPNYQFAAVIQVANGGAGSGNGVITAGEQTVNFFDSALATPALVSKTDTISGGSYFLGPDGRGTITINTADTDIGGNGIETFTFVYLNPNQALIAQHDIVPANTLTSATGTMDFQIPGAITAMPTGSYAFVTSGLNVTAPSTPQPLALGGILNIDSTTVSGNNAIDGTYSWMDEVLPNINSPGAPTVTSAKPPSSPPTGSFSTLTPDQFGMVTLSSTVPFVHSSPSQVQFTGYIVDANHIALIESDNTSGSGFGSTAGVAIAQATPALGLFDAGAVSGQYVFGVTGTDLFNFNTIPDTMLSAGEIFFDTGGSGSTGTLDSGDPPTTGPTSINFMDTLLQANAYAGPSGSCNVNGNGPAGAQISATFGGASSVYTVDTVGIGGAGIGRVKAALSAITPQPLCGGFTSLFLLYLTGAADLGPVGGVPANCPSTPTGTCPALLIAIGNANYPFIGTGIAYPQVTTPTFLPPVSNIAPDVLYGVGFTQYLGSNSTEYDGTGLMTAAPKNDSLSGNVDVGTTATISTAQGFTGTYNNPTGSSGGCFITVGSTVDNNPLCYPGDLSGSTAFQSSLPSGQIAVHFYPIDGSLGNPGGFFVETDWLQQMEANPGTPAQVSFGYVAAQAPLVSPSSSAKHHSATDKRGRAVPK